MSTTAHQLRTCAWLRISGSDTVRSHSHSSAAPTAVCTPSRIQPLRKDAGRLGPTECTPPPLAAHRAAAAASIESSGAVLVLKRRGQLGAVEPSVTARCGDGRSKPALADGAIERGLADPEELCRLARGDQTCPSRFVEHRVRECLDIAVAEAAVATRRDERRVEQATRDGTRNRRLADAKPGRYIPRTDQSVQDVVLRLTNPYQKAVAVARGFELPAWNLTSGAVVSSLKMCIDRRTRPWIPCQNFHCARCAVGLQKGQASSSVRTSPPAAKLGAGVEKSPGPSLF